MGDENEPFFSSLNRAELFPCKTAARNEECHYCAAAIPSWGRARAIIKRMELAGRCLSLRPETRRRAADPALWRVNDVAMPSQSMYSTVAK